jgi:hypothetical protein
MPFQWIQPTGSSCCGSLKGDAVMSEAGSACSTGAPGF